MRKAGSSSKGGKKKDVRNSGKVKKSLPATDLVRVQSPDAKAPILSTAVMGMKFMKRKADLSAEAAVEASKRARLLDNTTPNWKEEPQEPEEDTRTSIGNNMDKTIEQMQTLNKAKTLNTNIVINTMASNQVTPLTNGLNCTYEVSSLHAALPGRRSFGGFNKPIERYYGNIMEGHVQRSTYSSGSGNGDDMDVDEGDMKSTHLAAMMELPGRAKKPSSKSKKSGHGKK